MRWVFLLALLAFPAYAQEPPNRFPSVARELATLYPDAMRTYRTAVEKFQDYPTVPWIYSLEGPSDKPILLKIAGKWYFIGRVCNPTRCADNFLVYLIQADGGVAFAEMTIPKPSEIG